MKSKGFCTLLIHEKTFLLTNCFIVCTATLKAAHLNNAYVDLLLAFRKPAKSLGICDICVMRIVIATATVLEQIPLKAALADLPAMASNNLIIQYHLTGVGLLESCFSLTRLIAEQRPALILQAGIAGTFSNNTPLEKVVIVSQEFLADMGVEENEIFKDLFDLNLRAPNLFPYTQGALVNPYLQKLNFHHLPCVPGVTVNEITTNRQRIQFIITKYGAVVESMEGAALHYCCLQSGIPFVQMRAISNYVGERDKTQWKFTGSLNNLATTVAETITGLNTFNFDTL